MPTYDFVCRACGKKQERFQSIKDDSSPECCGKPTERVISGGQFILKGGGWPGKEIKRGSEDDYVRSASARARELKTEGRAAMEDVLTFKDVERMQPG